MIVCNDFPLNDNQLIFVAKITLDASYIYFSNVPNGITLDGHDYLGSLCIKVSMTPIGKNTNAPSGGGIGNVSSFAFQINNFTGYPLAALNPLKYFPETSMPYLSGRKVEVGFVWVGASTEAEITGIYTGFIEQSPVTPGIMDIVTIEMSELELIQLPYYETQKDTDNGISYTTALDEEQYGAVIPILYGDFYTIAFYRRDVNLAPAVLFNKENYTFKFASHQCFYVAADYAGLGDWDLFKYINSIDSYLQMTPDNGSYINNVSGSSTRLLSSTRTALEDIVGTMIVVPVKTGVTSDIVESSALYDYEYDLIETNLTLADTKQVSLSSVGVVNKSDVGVFQTTGGASTAGDIIIHIAWRGTSGHTGYLNFRYYSKAGSYSADSVVTSDTSATLIYDTLAMGADITTEDLFTYDFTLKNVGGVNLDSADIKIVSLWVELKNLIAFNNVRAGSARDLRNNSGGRR